MIEAYFSSKARTQRPPEAVVAMASPITGDRVEFTNTPWSFSIEELRKRIGFDRLQLINDFVANALAIPHLEPEDRAQVGGGAPVARTPVAVVGPGSGLGVSALAFKDGAAVPIQGEGGHVTMSPADAHEAAVLDVLRKRFDHVSAERVLSGPGLVNLYAALCELHGERQEQFSPAQVTDARVGADHPRAKEATAMFCAMLGTVAGNVALTLGEFNLGQALVHRTMRPVLDSIAVTHHTISRHDEAEFILDRSIKQAVAIQAPVTFILSPLLTGGKVFGG